MEIDEQRRPTPPDCGVCASKPAVVILRDGRMLCGACALAAVMPTNPSTMLAPRPTIMKLIGT